MTYIPLARKWRPKCFADLVGQEHVVTPLQNALFHHKLHHAYLFTGTRGVGKTTIARIFAKALNCQTGIKTEPCLQCESCIAIDEGHFFDLIEVDGASRTRVEDTRELIENIQYAPSSGRFKIFIIDEVHMLSTHSFNALLKTLEEPPIHVKFLLATTDPQKLPPTILSRCLQFHLKPITTDLIITQLSQILSQEQCIFDQDGLKLIAEKANGSMRDALTLTEQLIAAYPKGLYALDISSYLGYTLGEWVENFFSALLQQNGEKIITLSQQLREQQISYLSLVEQMLIWLNDCLIYQITQTKTHHSPLQISCPQFWPPKLIHILYIMFEKAQQRLDWAPNHAVGFQMLMLRALHTLELQQILKETPESDPIPEPVPEYEPAPDPIPEPVPEFEPEPESVPEPQPTPEGQNSIAISPEKWSEILTHLNLDGLGKSGLRHTTVHKLEHQTLFLEINANYKTLFTPTIQQRIETALSQYFQQNIKIKLLIHSHSKEQETPAIRDQHQKMQAEHELHIQIQEHPFIQRLINDFQGEIIEKSMTKYSDSL